MMTFFLYLLIFIPMSFNGFNFLQVFLFYFMFMFIINFMIKKQFFSMSYLFVVDGLCYFMIILSIWINTLMFMSSRKIYMNGMSSNLFSYLFLFLLLFLMLTFSSLNLIMFYIFFEVTLIPLLFLIKGFGYQPERLMAGFYIIFYM